MPVVRHIQTDYAHFFQACNMYLDHMLMIMIEQLNIKLGAAEGAVARKLQWCVGEAKCRRTWRGGFHRRCATLTVCRRKKTENSGWL